MTNLSHTALLKTNVKFYHICKRKEIATINPVIIHATLYHSEMLSRRLKMNIPIVNSLVNNSYHKRRYIGLGWKGKLALLKVHLQDYFSKGKVTSFIANSAYISLVHQRSLGISVSKINVIHRGREFERIQETKKEDVEAIRSNLPNHDTKLFIAVGRLIARKGHLDLLEAFEILQNQNSNVALWIVGEGEEFFKLEQRINYLGLSKSIKLLGNRKDIPALLAAADFFVFPSHYEGLPGALIEAMISKTPIIASDIPENKECLNDEMALFHQIRNTADLSKQLQSALVMKDWPQRTQLAYDYALQQFNITKIVQEYESVYERFLKPNN